MNLVQRGNISRQVHRVYPISSNQSAAHSYRISFRRRVTSAYICYFNILRRPSTWSHLRLRTVWCSVILTLDSDASTLDLRLIFLAARRMANQCKGTECVIERAPSHTLTWLHVDIPHVLTQPRQHMYNHNLQASFKVSGCFALLIFSYDETSEPPPSKVEGERNLAEPERQGYVGSE